MRASGYERVTRDYYVEPRWCVDALLDVETLDGMSWDPSCGGGNIPEAMKARGLPCLGSDLVDRGYGNVGVDFFDLRSDFSHVANIVTNPPFGAVERYVDHALMIATHKVAILARLALLEGIKRKRFFLATPLARVWVSSRRISMPPGGSDVEAKGGAIAYAWFVWELGHRGPATVGWIG